MTFRLRRKNLEIFLNQLSPLEVDALLTLIFGDKKVTSYSFDERTEKILAKVDFGNTTKNIKTFYIGNFDIQTADKVSAHDMNTFTIKLRYFLLKKFGTQYNSYDFFYKKNVKFDQKLLEEEKKHKDGLRRNFNL